MVEGFMIRRLVIVPVLVLSAGCAPLSPVVVTDVQNEYVIVGRDTTPFVSLQNTAVQVAESGAREFCLSMNQVYAKRYVLTSQMGPGKWAEATLHFRCVGNESKQAEKTISPN